MASREVYPKDAIKALRKLGFSVVHKKGSHTRRVHADGRRVTVAVHPKPLFVGTLHSILRQAEITRKELDEKL
ncbi:MAG: type II toxin-antitoxin system HicA family toxin [Candidatus Sungbacteria bacterium]|nr:type II toxin-antitoxin system HicA family toxin [Candidatus Sungbacteria bacterium]